MWTMCSMPVYLICFSTTSSSKYSSFYKSKTSVSSWTCMLEKNKSPSWCCGRHRLYLLCIGAKTENEERLCFFNAVHQLSEGRLWERCIFVKYQPFWSSWGCQRFMKIAVRDKARRRIHEDAQKTNLKLSGDCGKLFSPLRMEDRFAGAVVLREANNVLEWMGIHEVLLDTT